jgi:hypothetical protein
LPHDWDAGWKKQSGDGTSHIASDSTHSAAERSLHARSAGIAVPSVHQSTQVAKIRRRPQQHDLVERIGTE